MEEVIIIGTATNMFNYDILLNMPYTEYLEVIKVVNKLKEKIDG